MTSVVDRYYRKILQNIDNVRMKFDISALLIKSKEHASKLEDIESDITNNDTKIKKLDRNIILFNNNITNHIDNVKNDIPNIKSDVINLNTFVANNIPNDLKSKIDDITTIKSDITSIKSDLNSIDVNKINLSYNVSQITKKKTDNNLNFINKNIENIRKISNSQKYTISNMFLFNLEFEKDISFTTNIKEILVHEMIIEDDFIKDSYLELYESILYLFESLKSSYHILKEKFQILDKNDNILINFWFHPLSKGFIMRNFHIFKNTYYYKIKNDIDYLKIKLYLERIEYNNLSVFNSKLTNQFQSNFIIIKYLKYNNIYE